MNNRNATKRTIATFGVLAGLAGIEHGIGEIPQGNRAPDGLMIVPWPDSTLFRIVNGEPAMTIVPNIRITGILAILVSLIFLVWVTMFVQRQHGGLVLMLLSIVMLLVGGGFGPPILGIVLGVAATRINAPLTWWRAHLSIKEESDEFGEMVIPWWTSQSGSTHRQPMLGRGLCARSRSESPGHP